MASREKQKAQIEKAEQLQDLLLDHWIQLAQSGELSSTDCATIARLLSSNGWVLDPAAIPQQLMDKLTSRVKFDDDIDHDGDVPKLRAV